MGPRRPLRVSRPTLRSFTSDSQVLKTPGNLLASSDIFRSDIKKFFFLRKSGWALEQAARQMGESPSLEVFKSHVDVALWDVVSGDGSAVGLDDLRHLFQLQ